MDTGKSLASRKVWFCQEPNEIQTMFSLGVDASTIGRDRRYWATDYY